MRRLTKKIRQARCLHWFGPVQTHEYSEGVGMIICCEQRTFTYTEESRTCSRCGLIDTRRVGEAVYEGWR